MICLWLRTHLEEREAAEQRSETSYKRLIELVRVVTSSLSLGDLDPQDAHEKLSTKLAELVQVRHSIQVTRFSASNIYLF